MEEANKIKKKLPFDKDRLELLPDGGFALLGQKCKECGSVSIGRHPACMSCHSRDIENIELSKEGPLHNFSIVHLKPSSEWKGPVPYALSEVKLDEGPALTTLTSEVSDYSTLKIGIKMKLDIAKADDDTDGNEIIIYTWKPA